MDVASWSEPSVVAPALPFHCVVRLALTVSVAIVWTSLQGAMLSIEPCVEEQADEWNSKDNNQQVVGHYSGKLPTIHAKASAVGTLPMEVASRITNFL